MSSTCSEIFTVYIVLILVFIYSSLPFIFLIIPKRRQTLVQHCINAGLISLPVARPDEF